MPVPAFLGPLVRRARIRAAVALAVMSVAGNQALRGQDSSAVVTHDSSLAYRAPVVDSTGADIAVIYPDSLPDMPRSMSELLAARVPGVFVQRSSGAAGASSWISMRDASAVQALDPLVIVDGVRRVARTLGYNFFDLSHTGLAGERLAPSPIDDVPVDQVERVEILRGPAAAARYGRDARYGVIVVTTKRPVAGGPRFRASITGAIAGEEANFPRNFVRVDASGQYCPSSYVVVGACTQSTTSTYSVLRDRSPFTAGTRRAASINATGGVGPVAVALGASHDRAAGVLPMDGADLTALTARILAPIGSRVRLSASAQTSLRGVTQPAQGASTTEVISGGIAGGAIDCSSATACPNSGLHGYEVGTPEYLASLGPRHRLQHFSEGAVLVVDATPWLVSQSAVSFDGASDRGKRADPPVPNQAVSLRTTQDVVSHAVSKTFDQSLRAQWELAGLSATTTLVGRAERDLSHQTYAMFSLSSFNGNDVVAAAWGGSRFKDGRTSIRLEQRARLGQRADIGVGAIWTRTKFEFTTVRIRPTLDAFGDASWQIIDSTNTVSALRSLRLRAAAGQVSGYDPRALMPLAFVLPPVVIGPPDPSAPPPLQPQRSSELESGFDAVLAPAQVHLSITAYRRTDSEPYLLVYVPSPNYLGVTSMRRRVSGVEVSAGATLVDTRFARWVANGSVALSRDRVTKWNVGTRTVGGAAGVWSVVQEGKPFQSWMATPQLWNDTNGDGVIGFGEVTSTAYDFTGGPREPSRPTRTAALQNSLTIAGLLTLGAQLDYVGGHRVLNTAGATQCRMGLCAALYDPSAPLGDQATALSAFTGNGLSGFLEPGETVRLRELSASVGSQRLANLARAGSFTFTLAARNLATWSRYKGLDPEIDLPAPGMSLDGGNSSSASALYLPNTRQLTARLTLAY